MKLFPGLPGSAPWACLFAVVLGFGPASAPGQVAHPPAVEQWGLFELALAGPATGNPFTEVELSARFRQGERTVSVTGFYDGAGVYRIRFMPEAVGEWRYETTSNRPELNGRSGGLTVTPPAWMAVSPGILPAKIAAISCASRRMETAEIKLVEICCIAGLRIKSIFQLPAQGAEAEEGFGQNPRLVVSFEQG